MAPPQVPPPGSRLVWYQAALWNHLHPAHGREFRQAALITGYSGGKTWVGALIAVQQALANRPQSICVVCRSYGLAARTSFPAVLRILSDAGIDAQVRWSGTFMDVRFAGAVIFWRSADDPDSVKGPSVAGMWIDEPGLLVDASQKGEPTWNILSSRTREIGPGVQSLRLWMTGTPEGLNWLYDVLVRDRPPNLRLIQASAEANACNVRPGLFADLRRQYSERAARAYIDGQFVDMTIGQVYEAFRLNVHVSPRVAYDPRLPLCLSYDFNRSPLCALAVQVHGREGDAAHPREFHVVREWRMIETTTWEVAQEQARWLDKIGHKQGITIYGDASGQFGSQRDKRHDYAQIDEVLGQRFGRTTRDVPAANPPVQARVEAVNAALRAASVVIHDDCRGLIADLIQVKFRPGSTDIDKRSADLTHASDALGYLIHRERPGPRVATGRWS